VKYLIPFLFLFSLNSYSQTGVGYSVTALSVPEALEVAYRNFGTPYMLAPSVVAMTEKVTFTITENLDAKQFFYDYMSNIGLKHTTKKGVDYWTYTPKKEYVEPKFSFVYKPFYRDVPYLTSSVSSLVPDGSFNVSNTVSNSDDPFKVKHSPESLVFYGTRSDIARVRDALPLLDVPYEDVFVGGYVYEVRHNQAFGSGLQLAASLLSSKLNVQFGGGGSPSQTNFIQIKSGSLTALAQLFNTDSRFSMLSSPSLRVTSGKLANFTVGDETPTIGSVTYQGDNAVRSIEYRSSGVIFKVLPVVKSQIIDLTISQELSAFSQTNNGVDETPTLSKRSMQTSVGLKDGDVIMIGGLADMKRNDTKTSLSFLPFVSDKGSDSTKTDIVLILQVKKTRQ